MTDREHCGSLVKVVFPAGGTSSVLPLQVQKNRWKCGGSPQKQCSFGWQETKGRLSV